MSLFEARCNSCDGVYNSLDVHFTANCDNNCSFCIDAKNRSNKVKCVPNAAEIAKTIISQKDNFDDVLFLGGEPCLFLHELVDCITEVKKATNLKVYVTTSVPYTCFKQSDLFFKLLVLVDGLNISAQHYDEKIGDKIRGTKSVFDRQKFYSSIPVELKKKIRLTFNLVKPYFETKEEILKALHHYDELEFGSILVRELQHSPEYFVSFEKTMGLKLPSAYAHGCQSNISIPGEAFSTPILLKRSCSLVEESVSVTWADVLKAFNKAISKTRSGHNFGVVWQNGSLKEGW